MDFATPYWVNEGVRYLLSPDFLDAHDDAAKIIGELASDVAAVVSTEGITKSGVCTRVRGILYCSRCWCRWLSHFQDVQVIIRSDLL